MKVFVTGATGFIGENLVSKLLERNHEVYALCRIVTDRTLTLPKDVNIIYGDISEGHFLKKVIRQIKPEIVIHLVAPSSVYYGHYHPEENFETTVYGTINMQKACENLSSLEKFIFAGTSEEYGNQDLFPIKEDAPLKPNQPYAIAKVAADKYLQYCHDAQGFPSITVRPFNTYGRLKNFTFVAERIIYQMLISKMVLLGNSEPIRDLLYVSDHVEGYIKTVETPFNVFESSDVKALNLCSGVGTSILELSELIKSIVHFDGEIHWNKTNIRYTEIGKLIGDYGLASKLLGWKPQYSLREGLNLTVKKIHDSIEAK
jgi:dTDP-glucose 4,6-dehydratase